VLLSIPCLATATAAASIATTDAANSFTPVSQPPPRSRPLSPPRR
jgi:hypothetical protein